LNFAVSFAALAPFSSSLPPSVFPHVREKNQKTDNFLLTLRLASLICTPARETGRGAKQKNEWE
jgi:hypothetical protein